MQTHHDKGPKESCYCIHIVRDKIVYENDIFHPYCAEMSLHFLSFLNDELVQHNNDVIMGIMASEITSLMIVYSTVYSGTDERKHQSSASLAFVRGNSPVTGEFPAQRASNAENVSIWWRHHDKLKFFLMEDKDNMAADDLATQGARASVDMLMIEII